jgi:uncharacterized protein (TIGR01777 family)
METSAPIDKKVVIVGGSGFIGSKLTEALLQKGCSVLIIDLVPPRVVDTRLSFLKLNLATADLDPSAIDGCYGIINLAGATIGKRWNEAYKKLIYDSRIATTHSIVKAIGQTNIKPKVLVNASAAGYYGDQKEELLGEDHTPGKDFLAHVCVDWEDEARKAEADGLRVALIRTANVLGPGGLLASLEPLFKKGLGGYFGSGEQRMSWIHWKDIVGIYMFALEHENVRGAYNVGAGKTLSQKTLFKKFAAAIHAPFVWPVPRFAAKLALGDFGDALIDSQNTTSEKIIGAGYVYAIDDVDQALIDIYSR